MSKNKIRIGSLYFDVVEEEGLRNPIDNKEVWGRISYTRGAILVEKNSSKSMRFMTLWHEVVHGILDNAALIESANETLVDVLATGITQCLQDNELLRWEDDDEIQS